MGTDPDNDDYDDGLECAVCVDILFDGKTPKYVEVDMSGVLKCPVSIGEPPNGTTLLTQTEVCKWVGMTGTDTFEWHLNPDDSVLICYAAHWVFWFKAQPVIVCCDAFVNENDCEDEDDWGVGGYATVWWGPTIGP